MKLTFTLMLSVIAMLGMNAQVIWGGPGDPNGEFAGGLNDWTTVGISSAVADSAANAVWVWDEDGTADQGLFAGGNTQLQSPSVGNGTALFNSDFLDNGGVDFGAGVAPSAHEGALISPIINCSGEENVTVTFYQDYRDFSNTFAFLDVSNDGGTTYESYEINPDAFVNQGISFKNSFYRVNVSDVAANQDSVVLRFRFSGDYYFWNIDDVAVIRTPALDIGLDDLYYAPTYASTPITQLDAVDHEFAVDVFNLGTDDQYDVEVVASIFDTDLNAMFTDTMTIDTLFASDTIFFVFDTIVDAKTQPYAALGEYSIIYELLAGEDDLETRENLVGELFSITEDVYSVDRGLGQNSNVGGFWVGNIYATGDWGDSGNGLFTATKLFASEGSGSGTITGTVFRINDDIDADYDNFDVGADITVPGDHPSMVPVGFFIHNVSESGIQSIDLIDIDTDEPGITLAPNSRYLYIYTVEDGMRVQFDRSINYFQTTTVVYVPGDQLYLGGFGASYGLLAPVQIEFASSVEDNLLPSNSLKVFPNPTADQYNVALSFENSTDVTVLLTGIDGKIYNMETIKGVTELTKKYNTSTLSSGTYILRILTDEGIQNQKLVIQK